VSGYWLEVSVIADGEAAEAVAEALRPLAHNQSVVLEQRGDPDSLDPDALEPEVTVKIYLPGEADTGETRQRIEEIIYYLGRLYPMPAPLFRKLEDRDWAFAWREHYKPFRVGERIWIMPSWHTADDALGREADDIILTLDPGMAFGTGTHPTTQMCLQALEKLIRPGSDMLDVGTGSGILAVAAARLGAGKILGVDTDEQAVLAAQENALLNGVSDQLTIRRGSLESVAHRPWKLVVVNILAPVIIQMLKGAELLDYVAVEGRLLLSGIIEPQLAEVAAAIEAVGGQIEVQTAIRDWRTLIVSHKKTP
jgi:ribosomal protein L11 methyltransferase